MRADALTATDRLLELNDGRVGASTGYMESLRGSWPDLVEEARRFSGEAVELSALSAAELPALLDYLTRCGAPAFPYVSIHGPAKGWSASAAELARVLGGLARATRGVVMHPDTLAEPEAFAPLGASLLLENMDPRKGDARTVEELARYYDLLPEAGLCLDVAHVLLVDPTMRLAHDLLDAYGDRLREVHVSSILGDGTHVPLTLEDCDRFHDVLVRCRGVPWILEAAPG